MTPLKNHVYSFYLPETDTPYGFFLQQQFYPESVYSPDMEIILKNKIETRLKKLTGFLSADNIDTFMVLIEENRRYLSGYTGEDTQFNESSGALFITDDRFILATDSRYETQARGEAPLFDVVCYREGLAKEIPTILSMLKTRKLGFEPERISVSDYNKILGELKSNSPLVNFVETDGIVGKFRILKEEHFLLNRL